jgi:uncharacterized protein
MMLSVVQNSELDAGPHRAGTERFCVATGEVKPTADMIRFVVGPDGIVPDLKHKLPGRGLWVTATRAALADAIAKKSFARGFKREVRVGKDLVDLTEKLLVRATLDALSIANKAGAVVCGFAKTEAALTHARLAGLIQAQDAATDGAAKLKSVLKRRPDADEIAVIAEFSTAQLDLALGRSNVVHAALLAGSASDMFLTRLRRLHRFRTGAAAVVDDRRAASRAKVQD